MPGGYRARAVHALHGRHSVHRAHSTYGDKAAWYLPLTLTTDALGAGVPVALLLQRTGQPHPLACALAAAAAWTAVRAGRRRYAADVLGESNGPLAVLTDWLVLLGVLAVLRTAFGEIVRPSLALAGVSAAPLLTLAARGTTHRHLIGGPAQRAGRPPGAGDRRTEHRRPRGGAVWRPGPSTRTSWSASCRWAARSWSAGRR